MENLLGIRENLRLGNLLGIMENLKFTRHCGVFFTRGILENLRLGMKNLRFSAASFAKEGFSTC